MDLEIKSTKLDFLKEQIAGQKLANEKLQLEGSFVYINIRVAAAEVYNLYI